MNLLFTEVARKHTHCSPSLIGYIIKRYKNRAQPHRYEPERLQIGLSFITVATECYCHCLTEYCQLLESCWMREGWPPVIIIHSYPRLNMDMYTFLTTTITTSKTLTGRLWIHSKSPTPKMLAFSHEIWLKVSRLNLFPLRKSYSACWPIQIFIDLFLGVFDIFPTFLISDVHLILV